MGNSITRTINCNHGTAATLHNHKHFFYMILTVHHRQYVEIKCQLDAAEVFIALYNTLELLMMAIVVPETC